MNITRHNYEEYFILYLDNELSSDDRQQVELFVQENTDLKGEFELLLQTRLMPDDAVVFDKKQQLLKTALPAPINDSNFEEWLLLYIDDELTGQQKITVEEFLVSHPSAKTELELLEKTKLHPEPAVIFPNKETLYRREEKVRVIGFPLRRIAVAASLLLAISTAAFLVFNDKGSNEGKIISEGLVDTNSKKKNAPNNLSNDTVVAYPLISEDETIGEGTEAGGNSLAAEQKRLVPGNEKNDPRLIQPANRDTKLIVENKATTQPTNNLTSAAQNSSENKVVEEKQIAMAGVPAKDPLTINNDNKPTEVVTPDNSQSFNNGETAGSNEPMYAIDTDESGKKNKLRGFFRKVTRTFEKRTNIKATDDEDRLLLAGLAIKL